MFRVIGCKKTHIGLSNVFCSKENISPDTCININSTGVSSYDDFLDPSKQEYLRDKKNLVGRIDYMTPLEYFQACAEIFDSSVERLQASRKADDKSIDFLAEQFEKGRKFFLPYINYAEAGQEGLHRMMVLANHFGWQDQTFPVLVVEFADSHRHDVEVAKNALRSAIDNSIQYKYFSNNLPDELTQEIQWKLDQDAEASEVEPYTAKLFGEDDQEYVYSIVGLESDISIAVDKNSDIQYKDHDDFDISDEDLDIDLDDLESKGIDINDIDAVMKYLDSGG